VPKVSAIFLMFLVDTGFCRLGLVSCRIFWGRLWVVLVSVFGVPVGLLGLVGCFLSIHGEFDSGSGRTLAACLTHASRATPHLRVGDGAANG
jgi:hypothetical protein